LVNEDDHYDAALVGGHNTAELRVNDWHVDRATSVVVICACRRLKATPTHTAWNIPTLMRPLYYVTSSFIRSRGIDIPACVSRSSAAKVITHVTQCEKRAFYCSGGPSLSVSYNKFAISQNNDKIRQKS